MHEGANAAVEPAGGTQQRACGLEGKFYKWDEQCHYLHNWPIIFIRVTSLLWLSPCCSCPNIQDKLLSLLSSIIKQPILNWRFQEGTKCCFLSLQAKRAWKTRLAATHSGLELTFDNPGRLLIKLWKINCLAMHTHTSSPYFNSQKALRNPCSVLKPQHQRGNLCNRYSSA